MSQGLSDMLFDLQIALKSTNTEWMDENLEKVFEAKARKEELKLELKKRLLERKAQIKHDLAVMEAEHAGTMKRVELKIERDLNNYISFLDELDNMKGHIVAAFEGCSPIQALLIHQHSCRILNNMWEEKDIEQRQLLETKLLTLMASVQNDLASKLSTPEGTLKILAAPSK